MNEVELNDLIFSIMLRNEEHADIDKIFAINGILDTKFDSLTKEEQDDITTRLAIGILVFNANIRDTIDRERSWSRLPKVEISGSKD